MYTNIIYNFRHTNIYDFIKKKKKLTNKNGMDFNLFASF